MKAAPRAAQKSPVPPASAPHSVTSSALDIKFSEVTIFVEWLQASVRALEQGQPLPESPTLGAGEVVNWITAVQSLEDRRRQSEEKHVTLKEDLRREKDILVASPSNFKRPWMIRRSHNQHAKRFDAIWRNMRPPTPSCPSWLRIWKVSKIK